MWAEAQTMCVVKVNHKKSIGKKEHLLLAFSFLMEWKMGREREEEEKGLIHSVLPCLVLFSASCSGSLEVSGNCPTREPEG